MLWGGIYKMSPNKYQEFEYFLKSLKLKKESLKKLEVWELEYMLMRIKELRIKAPVEEIKNIILKQKLKKINIVCYKNIND